MPSVLFLIVQVPEGKLESSILPVGTEHVGFVSVPIEGVEGISLTVTVIAVRGPSQPKLFVSLT